MHDKQAAGVSLASPLLWLARGWRDLRCAPLPGLVHGLCVFLFGLLLLKLAGSQFWWQAGAFSGFMLVAPVVATGLYSVSRGLEQGQSAGLREVLALWRSRDARLVGFGLLLGFAMMFPRRKIVPLIPPIPMPAWVFVTLYGALELYLGVTGTASGIAHFAHLGGMIGGWIMLRRWRA